MIREHDDIRKPDDPNIKIWRYMDFTKFVSLLDKSALFFCRADKLGDRLEMNVPSENYQAEKEVYDRTIGAQNLDWPYEKFASIMKTLRYATLINSWHMNEYESAAMWSSYLKTNEGIAIQSTYSRLEKSLTENEDQVMIGKVGYIDYKKDKLENGGIVNLATHKFMSYEHEREVRALIIGQTKGEDFEPLYQVGKYVDINLKELIDKIYVAPNAPSWFFELVKSISALYNLEVSILQSELDDTSLH
jgi:hypothetical protein